MAIGKSLQRFTITLCNLYCLRFRSSKLLELLQEHQHNQGKYSERQIGIKEVTRKVSRRSLILKMPLLTHVL